ncbi:hypothetical protein [Polaromonas sp.]|uniref:hypothetical protein n=1 Tax=Polaromonas sp. TaxID=1869339 RepID=UPI00352A6D17
MKKNTTPAKTVKAFTHAALISAVGEAISNSDDPEIRNLRAPSIPTVKNISRRGLLKGKSIAVATELILTHMQKHPAFYAEKEVGAGMVRNRARLAPASNPVLELILSELHGLGRRITDIEKSVSTAMSGKNAEIHPLVLTTVNHLNDTRKFIMARLDNELQGGGRAGAPSRQFDSATAMDAQRILAGVSQIKDLLAGLVPPR